MATLFVWTEVGTTFVSQGPLAAAPDDPSDAIVPIVLEGAADAARHHHHLLLCELEAGPPAAAASGALVRIRLPRHLRSGDAVRFLRPCGARLVPAEGGDGGAVACGCGIPMPFPARWRPADLARTVDRLRGRLRTLHRAAPSAPGAADADAARVAAEIGWITGVLFRLGGAILRHGDGPLAQDCFEPGRPSARRRDILPEVERRLERQRDAVCVQLARAPAAAWSTGGGGGGGRDAAAVGTPWLTLRPATVTAKFQSLAQEVLRAAAALGEAAASSAGFDVLLGGEPPSRLRPRFQPARFHPLRQSPTGAAAAAAAIDAFAWGAEQTLRRHFEAMMAVWHGANALREFHRSAVACLAQVERHAARVLADPGERGAAAVWDAVRMTYQAECLASLHATVLGLVPFLLRIEAFREDERLGFRRFVARTLLCVSFRISAAEDRGRR